MAELRFARFFDIEWHPVKDELADKVLIPILGDQYGAVLERQELVLTYQNGAFFIQYHDDTLRLRRTHMRRFSRPTSTVGCRIIPAPTRMNCRAS